MSNIEKYGVDVITVTAYKCVHCEELFHKLDIALNHLDKCTARPPITNSYAETDFGNMVLKEG